MNLLDYPTQKSIKPSYSVFGCIVMVLMLLLGLNALWLPDHALAASYTWDGGGADNNWSTCANWSTDICPTTGDIVTFNSTSVKNSTVDAGWSGTLASLNIASGYTGTVTLARSLTTTTQFTQAAGTFTAANQTMTTAIFTLSAGSFTASSGTTTVTGALTISGSPTFSANGGTFAFGGGTATLSCNNVTFNLVTLPNTGAKTVSSNCSLPLGTSPTIANSVTLNGTISGSGTLTTTAGTLTLNSGAVTSGFSGIVANGNYTVAGATISMGSYTTVDFNAAFNLSSGSYTAPSGTATFASTFNITGGTFSANGGTVTFDGGVATLACFNATFNLVTFNAGTNLKTVSTNCSLPLGNNPTILARITLDGTLSGTGTITFGSPSNEVVSTSITANGVLSGFTGLATNSGGGTFTVSATNFDASNYTTFDMKYGFTLNPAGVFTAPSGNAYFGRNFTLNAGTTFNANGGTVVFNFSSATIACNNATFNRVIIDKSVGSTTSTIASDCNFPLGNNPSVSNLSGSITLSGTLSGTGTFNKTGSGTLQINSTGSLSGFSGFVETGTITLNGATLNLGSYTTVDFNGALNALSGTVFTAPSGTATFASAFVLSSGSTFNANGGTIELDGISNVSISCNNAVFNFVKFTHSAGTKTVDSTCSLPLGNNPTVGITGTSRVSLNGTLTGSGLLTIGTPTIQISTFTLGGGGSIASFSGLRVNGDLAVNGTYDFSNFTTFDIDGTVILNGAGNLTGPTAGGEMRGFTNNDGTFNANGGTVSFNGISSNIQCSNSSTNTFATVVLAGSGTASLSVCTLPLGNNPTTSVGINNGGTLTGSGTLTINGDVTHQNNGSISGFNGLVVNGDFQSYAGTLDMSNYTTADFNGYFWLVGGSYTAPASAPLYVSGSLFNSNSTDFTANGGTVVLDGTDQEIQSPFTFYNLTKQTSSAATLQIKGGQTQTILNKLTLTGQPAGLLSLTTYQTGTWSIDLRGTANVCSVDVTNSASIGNEITAYSSFSNSANLGWVFNDANCPSSGGGGGSGGVIEPTTAVTNFQFTQAAASAAATSDKQISLVLGATDQRLPSPFSSVLGKIPKGNTIINSILGFFAVCLVIIVVAGLGFWWLLAWRRRYNQEHWYIHARTNQDII